MNIDLNDVELRGPYDKNVHKLIDPEATFNICLQQFIKECIY